MAKPDAQSAATTFAVAATAAAATYFLTKRHFENMMVTTRSEAYKRDRAESEIVKAERKAAKLPTGVKLENASPIDVYLWDLEQLGKYFKPEGDGIQNKMFALTREEDGDVKTDKEPGHHANYNKLIGKNECIVANIRRKPGDNEAVRAYVRAGPRAQLHFNPKTVNAAIVTCGGLCPGLNNVIREITRTLYFMYGIQGKVFGIVGGYKGFYDPKTPPIVLTPENVENIHHEGGTILGSSRGGFDMEKILDFIKSNNIRQLYVIGGDGTHRGAFKIHETCMEKVSVYCGLKAFFAFDPLIICFSPSPRVFILRLQAFLRLSCNRCLAFIATKLSSRTIDNDVDYLDRSFGFITSVEAAQTAIRAAKVEASCNLPNGVGIVKLMGRSSGFIAAHATLGSGDVDLCLVPEVPIILEGPNGCLPHLWRRVKKNGYAVVVVAEGAGEELLGESTETDASGNKKLPQIGEFMKGAINEYFKKQGEEATVKQVHLLFSFIAVKKISCLLTLSVAFRCA
eukprot:CCRYP_004923-RB/>CCRYP_004923-RB protein AED:0.06 eAED:0.06 QI:169/0.83/0.85/1/0.66/0.42/7/4091/511